MHLSSLCGNFSHQILFLWQLKFQANKLFLCLSFFSCGTQSFLKNTFSSASSLPAMMTNDGWVIIHVQVSCIWEWTTKTYLVYCVSICICAQQDARHARVSVPSCGVEGRVSILLFIYHLDVECLVSDLIIWWCVVKRRENREIFFLTMSDNSILMLTCQSVECCTPVVVVVVVTINTSLVVC